MRPVARSIWFVTELLDQYEEDDDGNDEEVDDDDDGKREFDD